MSNLIPAPRITRPQSLSAQITERIRQSIVSGEIGSGEKLIEEKVARNYGVSRVPVREAIKKLEEEGLLVRQGRSLTVTVPDPGEIPDLIQLKISLDSHTAALASKQATPEQLAPLKEALQFCRKAATALANAKPDSNRKMSPQQQTFNGALKSFFTAMSNLAQCRHTHECVNRTDNNLAAAGFDLNTIPHPPMAVVDLLQGMFDAIATGRPEFAASTCRATLNNMFDQD